MYLSSVIAYVLEALPEEEQPDGEEASPTQDAQETAEDEAPLALSASDLQDLLNDPKSLEGQDSSWNLSSINQ